MGLPLLDSAEAPDNVVEGDTLEIDIDSGNVVDVSRNMSFSSKPIPAFMQELIRDGGLMRHTAKRLNLDSE